MKNIKKTTFALLSLSLGLGLGYVFFSSEEASSKEGKEAMSRPEAWTCAMHPQVRHEEPGSCPICGMDLIPLEGALEGEDSLHLRMSPAAVKIARVSTTPVRRGGLKKHIRLQGTLMENEKNHRLITARFLGRIEALYVHEPGEYIRKGAKIASVYAPDLLAVQQELLEAWRVRESYPGLYEAVYGKLRDVGILDIQIQRILKRGRPSYVLDVHAPFSGTVLKTFVAEGGYVKEGMPLLDVLNVESLWAVFEVYEKDLSWLDKADSVHFQVLAFPGKRFAGRIARTYPRLDPRTHTAAVRVRVANPEGTLMPQMFAIGQLEASLDEGLLIPRSALLWTGTRSVVYVKKADTWQYALRSVVLGPQGAEEVYVVEGLREGEEVVSRGAFKVDAAAQLAGKPNMIYRKNAWSPPTQHPHH